MKRQDGEGAEVCKPDHDFAAEGEHVAKPSSTSCGLGELFQSVEFHYHHRELEITLCQQ